MIDDDIELHPWKKTDLPAFWPASARTRAPARCWNNFNEARALGTRNSKYFMGRLDAINPIVLERAADAHQRNYR